MESLLPVIYLPSLLGLSVKFSHINHLAILTGLPKASDLQGPLPPCASMEEFLSSHCSEAGLTLYPVKCPDSCFAHFSSPVLVNSRYISHAPRSPPSHLDLVYLLFIMISPYPPQLLQLESLSGFLGFQSSASLFSIAFML